MSLGIARGHLLDDRIITGIVEATALPVQGGGVIDFNHDDFMRGWLKRNRPRSNYRYGDAAAPSGGKHDAAFLFESPVESVERAHAMATHLNPLGRYAVTIVSLGIEHKDHLFDALITLQRGSNVLYTENLTKPVREFAGLVASRYLMAESDCEEQSPIAKNARRVLDAIERETFAYTLVIGSRPAGY